MFRYLKAFKLIMKEKKDNVEQYLYKYGVFAILGIILAGFSEYIENIILLTISIISLTYGFYCAIRALWILEQDDIKKFFKQLKETADNLK